MISEKTKKAAEALIDTLDVDQVAALRVLISAVHDEVAEALCAGTTVGHVTRDISDFVLERYLERLMMGPRT